VTPVAVYQRKEATMRVLFAIAAMILFSGGAYADDAGDCNTGIEMIKAEIAKKPGEPKLSKLNKLLADAEREAKEREYDECIEAVDDAKELTKG
jgi:hypothetical protein